MKILKKHILGKIIGTVIACSLWGPCIEAHQMVSPNVPQDSYVYEYIDKLDALGYISEPRQTSKPYNRLQVAKWIIRMDNVTEHQGARPIYVDSMLLQLHKDFIKEIESLQLKRNPYKVKVNESQMAIDITNAEVISQNQGRGHTNSNYQLFSENHRGYQYSTGLNLASITTIDGYIGNHMAFSLMPRIDVKSGRSRFSLPVGYIKTNIGAMEIQVGKDDMWWGPMCRSTLGLTTNAMARTGIKLSSIDPIVIGGTMKRLGAVKPTIFYSGLSSDRDDVKKPNLLGARVEIMPSNHVTIGASLLSIVGGRNRHLSWSDWKDFFVGKNADIQYNDKWNSLAGYDILWKNPNFQFYASIYGEDQARGIGFIPSLSEIAWNTGVYVPRLSQDGRWDLRIEAGRTNKSWYNHSVYTDGYTHKGHIIGDAMGNSSRRLYGRIGHFDKNANQIALNLEYLDINQLNKINPKIVTIWIDSRHRVDNDLLIEGRLGLALVDKRNTSGHKNYLMSILAKKEFN